MNAVTCPHCQAALPEREIIEGWCETCGKKVPSWVRDQVSGTALQAHPAPRSSPSRRTVPTTRSRRWWEFGLIGGVTLSVATLIKVIRRLFHGAVVEGEWTEAVGFAAAVFGMGFVCGLIVWLGQGLSRRLGWLGDALVGMVVMLVFFTSCLLLFAPELLGAKWEFGGLPLLCLGAVFGLIGGVWMGRDMRKEESETQQGGDD